MTQNDTARANAEGRWREERRPISVTHHRHSVYLGRPRPICLKLFLTFALFVCGSWRAQATVAAVSVQSPVLSSSTPTSVTTPIHFEATADSDLKVTGYVVYVDGNNVYRNFAPSLDAWVVLPPGGTHSVFITAWDDSGSHLSTATYLMDITGVVPPTPPILANRTANIDRPESFPWSVDNGVGVGGQCNHGSMGTFDHGLDPNTTNSPGFDGNGRHFLVKSRCTYDDSLFFWKNPEYPHSGHTNFLWDFWFYIPTTTQNGSVQVLEFDFFQAVRVNDGVHEFMFGSQCNYATNQWQLWLPKKGRISWANAGVSPCQFSTGTWHHAVYFLQRVTSSGYQDIPLRFGPTTDSNTSLRFGTLSIDGVTTYLGQLSESTIPTPAWSPVIGVQHQLDSAVSGVTIEEYVDKESLTTW
jgi:hypothetical protein